MKRKRKGREVLQVPVQRRKENEGKGRKRRGGSVLQILIQVGEIDIEIEGKSKEEKEAMRKEERKSRRDNQIPNRQKKSYKGR